MTSDLLNKVYLTLLEAYGKQHWWPAQTQYEMMAGAVLTQNTTWKNVETVMPTLKPYLTPDVLLALDNDIIEQIIRPTGFFRQKREYLKNLFQYLQKHPIDELEKKETKDFRNELLRIKGIGKETADSILLYAFDREIFVIDTYTKRLLKKIGITNLTTYDDYQEYIEKNIKRDYRLYNEFHALIVVYNKTIKTSSDPLEKFIIK